jgi:two-component system, NtrC family, response regulator HydG
MQAVLDLAERVALAHSTVLITGESGVGKERLARYIHARSRRARAPFVALNCGAVAPTLLESELFGHRRGAFTGAHADRPGLFEAADTGTLFLDELAEMPLDMQATLLRVIQEREVRRVGENQVRHVDVRIVAATNHSLVDDVRLHKFREDLYYRLSVIVIRIPPLRARPADLDSLLTTLLRQIANRLERSVNGYTADALELLRRHQWPGNVRELQNAIEHACVLAEGDCIDVEDLPDQVQHPDVAAMNSSRIRSLRDVERDYILSVMRENGGNRRLAAAQLQIGIATLHRKLRHYRRQKPEPTPSKWARATSNW